MVWSMFGFPEDEGTHQLQNQLHSGIENDPNNPETNHNLHTEKPQLQQTTAAGATVTGHEKTIKDRTDEETTSRTVEEAFECDYEKSCTPLYKRIESALSDSDWHPIVKFLDTGYWPGSLFMDNISPSEQVRTWVTRFDPDDSTMVKWSQLPLHLAIVCGAPFKVIGRIVELYPQAVRCTDDQHMLPLHLALRHNASDEIVAYFLMQFPEAVNAKGKDNRTPIDCAMRAKDKLRGKILQIFVTKTKGKNITANSSSKEVAMLQASLQNKISQLEEAQSKLIDLRCTEDRCEEIEDRARSRESELLAKIKDLEKSKIAVEQHSNSTIKRLQDELLMAEVEHNKRMKELKDSKYELEEEARASKEEKAELAAELEVVQSRVLHVAENTPSPNAELDSLKEEVDKLKAYRMEHSRSLTAEQIDALRKDVEKNLKESAGKTADELKQMQRTVDELRKSEGNVKTVTELNGLRSEVEQLRQELKEREEASKIKLELDVLKKAMEVELKNVHGKTEEELHTIRQVVEGMNIHELENKTSTELSTLKTELEALKKEMKENELANKTKQDVEDLKLQLEKHFQEARGATRVELATMKKHVDAIQVDINASKSNDEIVALKKELETVKQELRNNELAMQTKREVVELKKNLQKELDEARGVTKMELANMMNHVNKIQTDMSAKKSTEQIIALKSDVDFLKDSIKQKEEASKMKLEMVIMKKALEAEIRNSVGKTKEELITLKNTVLSAADEPQKLDKASLDELASIKNELEQLKLTMKKKEEADITKKELEQMRIQLEQQMKSWEGETRDELLHMKRNVEALARQKLETKSSEEWITLQTEIAVLKKDVKSAEEAYKIKQELEALKISLESELKSSDSKTEEELSAMKKAVDSISFENIEIKNAEEWEMIRSELDALKQDLKEKDYGNIVLKKELEELRMSQEALSAADDTMKKERKGIRKLFSRWRKKSANDKSKGRKLGASKGGDSDEQDYEDVDEATSDRGQPAVGDVSQDSTGDDPIQTILPPSVAKSETSSNSLPGAATAVAAAAAASLSLLDDKDHGASSPTAIENTTKPDSDPTTELSRDRAITAQIPPSPISTTLKPPKVPLTPKTPSPRTRAISPISNRSATIAAQAAAAAEAAIATATPKQSKKDREALLNEWANSQAGAQDSEGEDLLTVATSKTNKSSTSKTSTKSARSKSSRKSSSKRKSSRSAKELTLASLQAPEQEEKKDDEFDVSATPSSRTKRSSKTVKASPSKDGGMSAYDIVHSVSKQMTEHGDIELLSLGEDEMQRLNDQFSVTEGGKGADSAVSVAGTSTCGSKSKASI